MRNNEQRRCPTCGRVQLFDDQVCPYCGQPLKGGLGGYETVTQKARRQREKQHWFGRHRSGNHSRCAGVPECTFRETQEDQKKKQTKSAKKIAATVVMVIALVDLLPVLLSSMDSMLYRLEKSMAPPPSHVYQDQFPYEPPLPAPKEEDYFYISNQELEAMTPGALWQDNMRWQIAYPDLTEEEQELMGDLAWKLRNCDAESAIVEDLKKDGYGEPEIWKAMERMDVDWAVVAQQSMLHYLRSSTFSPPHMERQLKYEGFTPAQIEYAMGHNQVDWYHQLELEMAVHMQDRIYSEQGLRERNKNSWLYDEEDFEKFLSELDVDWNTMALMAGARYLDRNGYTQQELRNKLLDERFTLEQIQYAEKFLFP